MPKAKYDLNKILNNFKIDALNPMQIATIEANKKHADVVVLSATGSGKTLAFLLPVLELLDQSNKKTQAMIIVPTRELALQIDQVFKTMGTGFKISCCYGGHKRETEENNLIQPPAVIVGTAGRLADHIRRGNITTDTITTLVLDEFDKSMEMGFTDEMSFIISSLPSINKRILTSATHTHSIPEFIGIKDPEYLEFVGEEKSATTQLAILTVLSPEKDKADTLFKLLCYIGNRSAIVFCNHRESVERTSELLTQKGIYNVFYHGAMEQQERDSALIKFRNGTFDVLVTTDLASRGLDIPNIRYIIHYHLPHTEDMFIHRNGRTARMDASGTIILILSEEEKLPEYVKHVDEEIQLPETEVLPDKPKWSTLYISVGKKDKVNKIDIVGYLTKRGDLKMEDIGLIEVKDFFSFVAVRKTKINQALHLLKEHRLKNKKVKVEVAK